MMLNQGYLEGCTAPALLQLLRLTINHALPSVLCLPPGGGSCYQVFLVLRQVPLLQDLPR